MITPESSGMLNDPRVTNLELSSRYWANSNIDSSVFNIRLKDCRQCGPQEGGKAARHTGNI